MFSEKPRSRGNYYRQVKLRAAYYRSHFWAAWIQSVPSQSISLWSFIKRCSQARLDPVRSPLLPNQQSSGPEVKSSRDAWSGILRISGCGEVWIGARTELWNSRITHFQYNIVHQEYHIKSQGLNPWLCTEESASNGLSYDLFPYIDLYYCSFVVYFTELHPFWTKQFML